MSGVDNRVVQMQFDNAAFKGIQNTLSSLDKLNKGLALQGATKGLDNLSGNGLTNLASGISSIASKFSALGVIGVTALANITTKAIDAGVALVKSLTIDPIKAGLDSYNEQINATQVILANTAASGVTLKDVTATLAELQTYANLTVYSFSEMTSNIGKFTAAGVPLKQATAAIKGLANVAALSGANTQQMSSAMYQMSQALSTGVIRLQDWNSLSNANMAGTNVQKAIEATARAIGGVSGKNMDAALKKFGNFRQSLQSGWLTSDIFSKSMGVMAGTIDKATGKMTAFSVAQLEQQGYSKKDAEMLHTLSQAALDSAIKIRTLPQLMQALKEEVATAYGQVFKTIFGDINQATDLFTNLHNVAENALTAPIYKLNTLLQAWAKLGGRTKAIDAVKNAFKALGSVLDPIKNAFQEIFPPATAQGLLNITTAIDDFFKKITLGQQTMDNLQNTFAGVFAALDIGWQIIKKLAGVLVDLFSSATAGGSGILGFTASIGDWLVLLDDAVKKGDGLTKFFAGLETVLKFPIKLLREFASLIGQAFDNIGNVDTSGLDKIKDRFSPLGEVGKVIGTVFSHLGVIFETAYKVIKPVLDKIGQAFAGLSSAIEKALSGGNYSNFLDTINTGLFAGLILLIRNFMNKGLKDLVPGQGIFGSIKEVFEQLTGNLKTMQQSIKANIILKIAAALAILTVSVVALSLINSAALTKSLTALTVMFAQLAGSLAIMTKIAGTSGFVKLPIIASSMILLATAIDILVIAVAAMAKLSWNELIKGLTGVSVLLAGLVVVTKTMSSQGPGMIIAAGGLILLATAINILVTAVTNLAGLSWGEMAKGLTGVAALLVSLGLFTKFADADAGGLASGAGLVLLATGILILSKALAAIGQLSWGEIAKGLVTIAASLIVMSAAVDGMEGALPGAAALLIVAAALNVLVPALQAMGNLSWGEIAKALVTMAGALTIMAIAANSMEAALPGAAAMLVVAASIRILAPALESLGKMSWGGIAKGLVVIAGALTIFAVAAYAMEAALPGAAAILVMSAALAVLAPVLTTLGGMSWGDIAKGLVVLTGALTIMSVAALVAIPLAPGFLVLGASILLLGAGMALAGVGVLAFSVGLTALSVAGAAGAAAIVGIVTTLLGILPAVATALGASVVAFAKVIATAAPAMEAAMVAVLTAFIDAITKLTPKIVKMLDVMLTQLLNLMISAIPKMTTAGIRIITGVLNGLAQNIGGLVTAGANVIVNFLKGVSANVGKVADQAAKTIIAFVNATATAINNNSAALGRAGGRLGVAIVTGMVNGLASAAGQAVQAAANLAKKALDAAKHVFGVFSPSREFHAIGEFVAIGLANGINQTADVAAKASENMGKDAIQSMTKTIAGLSDLVPNSMDLTPTITPVLDLSGVKSDAGTIAKILTPPTITVGSSFDKAVKASTEFADTKTAIDQATLTPGDVTTIDLTQNNYSPKALSNAEIYRQTKNQISTAKGALTANAN